jgi:hypothetical protein
MTPSSVVVMSVLAASPVLPFAPPQEERQGMWRCPAWASWASK